MEEKPEVIVSTQKKLLASHDPGWNDPPSWANSSHNPTGETPPKRILNKRIAFPLNYKTEQQNSALQQNKSTLSNAPPTTEIDSLTTGPHKPPVKPTSANTEDTNLEKKIDKDQVLKVVLDNFYYVMEQLDSNKTVEIQKRLDRMQVMWKEDKLNNVIQEKLFKISEALKESNFEKVDQLHISLMITNASACSSWIPGIRQLITEIKNKNI